MRKQSERIGYPLRSVSKLFQSLFSFSHARSLIFAHQEDDLKLQGYVIWAARQAMPFPLLWNTIVRFLLTCEAHTPQLLKWFLTSLANQILTDILGSNEMVWVAVGRLLKAIRW